VGIEEGAPLIAKFYRTGRWSDGQIIEEHLFTLELAEHELPVVAPQLNRAGETLFSHRGFRFALYPRKGGHAPELDNLEHLKILGRMLGRIHLVGACQPFRKRPVLDCQSFGHASVALLREQFIPVDYRESYQALTSQLLALLDERFAQVGSIRKIRTHGDCHSGNMLWRDGAPSFVDFDDARMAPAIQDLWMLLSGDAAQQGRQLEKILAGYREFSAFNPAELQLIEPLRTLRMLNFSAWLARRWDDPAFPSAFPWFNSIPYWGNHILELREQFAVLQEPPLQL
jgi:Ser/Thr protein kinase RdoA (MazF antagonist)